MPGRLARSPAPLSHAPTPRTTPVASFGRFQQRAAPAARAALAPRHPAAGAALAPRHLAALLARRGRREVAHPGSGPRRAAQKTPGTSTPSAATSTPPPPPPPTTTPWPAAARPKFHLSTDCPDQTRVQPCRLSESPAGEAIASSDEKGRKQSKRALRRRSSTPRLHRRSTKMWASLGI